MLNLKTEKWQHSAEYLGTTTIKTEQWSFEYSIIPGFSTDRWVFIYPTYPEINVDTDKWSIEFLGTLILARPIYFK
jgi:hypothetical protein